MASHSKSKVLQELPCCALSPLSLTASELDRYKLPSLRSDSRAVFHAYAVFLFRKEVLSSIPQSSFEDVRSLLRSKVLFLTLLVREDCFKHLVLNHIKAVVLKVPCSRTFQAMRALPFPFLLKSLED